MLWIYCGLFLFSVVGESGTASAAAAFASKREADYTLDDSFWNEESPVGEVERLLREYRQNQELVRNIGAHYYQIIYPVQLRHHEKMGISTREIGAPKVRKARSTFPQRGYGGEGGNYQGTRGRTRTGKHYHRTSLLIKAFNHKFRLDLELNTQLLAPNLMQKHFLQSGAEQFSKQEIEHCYYHGTVKDYPGASAAFHTCNGVSGVIHVGNETFVIHPFYGGDLSKHPHVIFEARTKANKGCANSGNLEWRMKNIRRQKHLDPEATARTKRDVREATKYIETAIVIDKAMFDKRNGSTRAEVVHDAIQVANIADLYFRTLNTRVSVVYIETWQGSNQAPILKNEDISRSLLNFNDYTSRKLFKVDKDTTQLLTGELFQGGEAGMAVPETVCTSKSVGISVDINTYEPHLLAGTMAHMIGHNIGMGHDDGREECFCRDWHGCIMAQSIVGLENVQPYKFSECSKSDYVDALRIGHGICLLNKPNELEVRRTCGNGIVEEGEDCDCGTIDECHELDPCCDPITCKLTKESECASGPCCDNCRLREHGVICRDAQNECDLPEHCTGEHGQCPQDIHKKNGNPCGVNTGYCFNGVCPTLSIQCEQIWGPGGISADLRCFEQFNSKGSINGHCGRDSPGHYIKCAKENVRCGSLQCQLGNRYPIIAGMDEMYSRTIISIKSIEYECKATSGTVDHAEIPDLGLVRDGTPCGENLICVNQTCTSIFPHIDQGKCPTNHNNLECSGHGYCTNINKCYCEVGWSGPDCSIQLEITIPPMHSTVSTATMSDPEKNKNGLASIMKKNITPYGADNTDNLSTLSMVFIMVGVVKGVFICFALMAVCYRKSTVPKYEPPYVKKPISKKYTASSSNHSQEDSMENANKILSFGNMPSYSRADSQRVLFRPSNHMSAAAAASHFQEHKMQQLKRMGVGSGSEEDPTHSGEEESVSFIDLQHNNLSKLPEKKGILKKHGGYGLVMVDGIDKWGDDSQSDNLEIMSQSDNNIGEMMGPGGGGGGGAGGGGSSMSEVERTLKSLNGYHEDILEALRNAASHRGATATPSGSTSLLSEEILRKTLQDCSNAGGYTDYGKRVSSQEKICDMPQTHTVLVEGSPSRLHIHQHQHQQQQPDEDEDDEVPPCGPIRIRNLEDLIRQLEHHSRHMSPSGSEDIRMSETEADRHYRLESSSVCSESSQSQSRCRGRGDDETRFVYGRYRQPTGGRHQYPHHQHQHHQHMAEEESIYETADHDRGADQCGDTPDSESDEFIQAQQQLVRWASEEAVSKAGPSNSSGGGGGTNGVCPVAGGQREYFPSPVTSESEESGGEGNSIARAPPSHHHHHHHHHHHLTRDSDNDSPTAGPSAATVAEQTALLSRPNKRYPEYKH